MTHDDDTSNWQKRLDRLADERQREATAATLLAAMLTDPRIYHESAEHRTVTVAHAVAWTDALRAALAVKP